jgi:undecaprenyl diphosphate synthase
MDGNGRWAKQRGISRINGHQNAIQAVRETTEVSAELGVEHLTLYAFSTENWERPKLEVDGLMALLVETINKELPTLHENNIRLLAIGKLDDLPAKTFKSLSEALKVTEAYDGMELVLALNYSGRWDIANAVKNAYAANQVDQFDKYLSTAGIPDPELLIRTSGEMRISNFLLWQIAYTELYFTEKLWPDYRKEDLVNAILAYQKRERR